MRIWIYISGIAAALYLWKEYKRYNFIPAGPQAQNAGLTRGNVRQPAPGNVSGTNAGTSYVPTVDLNNPANARPAWTKGHIPRSVRAMQMRGTVNY